MSVYRKYFVVSLLAYVVQREASAADVCSEAGIDFQSIKQGIGPDLTDEQFDDLWSHAALATGDPLFGLHLGESMRLAALGIVGDIIRNSPTIGDAVTQAASFLALVTDLFTMKVTQKGKRILPALRTFSTTGRTISARLSSYAGYGHGICPS